MEIKLDFKKIFEDYVNEANERIKTIPTENQLGTYKFLNDFSKDPIEFKYLNNSWCGLDELIWEKYRSDYRRLSKKNVRQQIIDNANLIKILAKEAIHKINFNQNQIHAEQSWVDSLLNYVMTNY